MAMTIKQWLLKKAYPLITWLGQKAGKGSSLYNRQGNLPATSFHAFDVVLNNGQPLSLASLKGKKVLVVNTASNCGYTAQYAELQKLYQHSGEELEIIGFPANDFKEQEKGSDEDIASFCTANFGVSFPLAKKSSVQKSAHQHLVFQWLSDAAKNGWNNKAPEWNFSKYLIDGQGVLTHYFAPAVSPLSSDVLKAISQ